MSTKKSLSQINSEIKDKAFKLRFKANPSAELAKIKKEAERLHAEMKARAPKKAKLSSKAELTELVVPRELRKSKKI